MAALITPTDAREEARFHEQIAQQYRRWVDYLSAQIALLGIQASRSQVAFEYAESREEEERTARATIASVPPPLRTLFDAVVEQERQEQQRLLSSQQRPGAQLDPDEALRAALGLLRNDATGARSEPGRGLMPRGQPDDIRWYEVDIHALQALPTAASYAAGGGAARPQRLPLTIGGAAVAILLLVVWMLLPRGTPQSSTQALIRVNATPVAPWPIARAILETRETEQSVGLTRVTTGTWPALDTTADKTPRGAIRTTSLFPIEICIPGKLLSSAQSLTLPAASDRPARRYTLSVERPAAPPDLIIEPCAGDARQRRYGALQEIAPTPDQALGAQVTLGTGAHVTVESIVIVGAGDEPALPAGQARVVIQIASTAALDWPTLAPTLLLPSGMAILPSETVARDSGVELRYLVPAPGAALPVAWSMTPDPAQPTLRWRMTLQPPESRLAILRAQLVVASVRAEAASSPGSVRVTITVTNQGQRPLALTPETIQVSVGERVLAMAAAADLGAPLAPGEQREFAREVPEQPQLLLTIGAQRYAIER